MQWVYREVRTELLSIAQMKFRLWNVCSLDKTRNTCFGWVRGRCRIRRHNWSFILSRCCLLCYDVAETASSGSNPVLMRLTSNVKHFYCETLVLRRALSAPTSLSSGRSPERMWFSALLTVFWQTTTTSLFTFMTKLSQCFSNIPPAWLPQRHIFSSVSDKVITEALPIA